MILNLHIGYAKTATTYLQEHVYPNLTGINYSGRYINKYGDDRDHLEWVYTLSKTSNLDVDSMFRSIPQSNHENHLFSHEVFMRPYRLDETLKELKKLQNHTSELRILVSIRNPADLVFSRYVHDISTKIFSYYPLEKALDYKGNTQCLWPMCGNNLRNKLWRKSPFNGGSCLCNRNKVKAINIPYYDLQVLHEKLSKLFGFDQVHYIISEQLRLNPKDEILRLCKFLGHEHTPVEFDETKLASSGESNKRSNLQLYQRLKAENSSNGVLDGLTAHFSRSNKKFAELANLNVLDELGYF